MEGQILAMGGGALLSRDSRIEDFMLGLARTDRPRGVHGIDRALQEAWQRGAVVGGMSAGAN